MTDLENDLRDALHRAGEQVDPDVDRAWSDLAAAPRRRPGRSLVVLGAAAAVLLVVAVSVTVVGGDDDEDVVTDAPITIAADGIPAEAIAVTREGRLISIDTADSRITELAEVTGADALDVNPADLDQLWFSECCEPAAGLLRSMSLASGEIVDQGMGLDPAVDLTGSRVAVASTVGLGVIDRATGDEVYYDQEAGGGIAAPVWVADDTVAYQRIVDGTWDVGVLDLGGDGVLVLDSSDPRGRLAAPVMTEDGLLVAELCCADDEEDVTTSTPLLFDPETGEALPPPPIDYQGEVVAQDVQDGWLLVTYADGRLVAHDLETGDSVAMAEDIIAGTWGPGEGSTPPPTEQRYRATITVLESPEHGPQLCAGGMRDSLPPQCGGPDVLGWDWTEADDEMSQSGTTWGEYTVVGTWDGRALTLTEPPRPPEPEDPADDPLAADGYFETRCPEPAGGWQVVDSATTTEDALQAASAYVRSQPDGGGTWIDQTVEGPVGSEVNAANRPDLLILNVSFTGDLDRHEAAIREVWGGRLCVSEAPVSAADLATIRAEVEAEVDFTYSAIDEVDGHVDIGVLVDDGLQARLDQQHGEGIVRLIPTLRPIEG